MKNQQLGHMSYIRAKK